MATYKKPCLHCKTMIDGDARFCPACASSTPFGYNCPACLKEISPNDAVCAGCGRRLWIPCAICGSQIFVGGDTCGSCGASLKIMCQNPRCGQLQFFLNTKCTACGKKIKTDRKRTEHIQW